VPPALVHLDDHDGIDYNLGGRLGHMVYSPVHLTNLSTLSVPPEGLPAFLVGVARRQPGTGQALQAGLLQWSGISCTTAPTARWGNGPEHAYLGLGWPPSDQARHHQNSSHYLQGESSWHFSHNR